MDRVDGEAQDILGFQVAMLEDDALAAPAPSDLISKPPPPGNAIEK